MDWSKVISRKLLIKDLMEKRTSLEIQISVLKALLTRELKTRLGQHRLGIAWIFIEPLLQIMVFMAMFYFRDKTTIGGLEFPVFLATGLAPLLYFKKVISQSLGAVAGNKNLLIYRQVRVFDLFLARFLLEAVLSFGVLVLLITGAWWLGYEVDLVNSLNFILIFILLSLLAFGFGLIFGVISTLSPEVGKFVPPLLQPLMFISGTFFSINELPSAIQPLLLWNPLLHAFELMRSSFSFHYDISLVSMEYLMLWTLASLTVGVLMIRANWRKMLAV